jgi:predicted ATPase
MNKIISEMKIKAFRGITTEIVIEFNGSGSCFLIYGENGSGKSSISDAIEFCLQKRISHSYDEKLHKVVNRRCNHDETFVSIKLANNSFPKLSNGSILEKRKIKKYIDKDNQIKYLADLPYECIEFESAPIVLRREDIIDWWNLTEKEKKNWINKRFKRVSMKKEKDVKSDIRDQLEKIKNVIKEITKSLDIKDDFDIDETINSKRLNDFFGEVEKQYFANPQINIKNMKKGRGLCLKACKTVCKLKESLNNTDEDSTDIMLKDINKDIENIFIELKSNSTHIKGVRSDYLAKGEGAFNVEISIDGEGGQDIWINPKHYLSEANRDVLALSVYLGMIRYAANNWGHSKLLVLDDIFQSVDVDVRLKSSRKILKMFHDFQLVFITHDRMWMEQLCRMASNVEKYYIKNWDSINGPKIFPMNEKNIWGAYELLKDKLNKLNDNTSSSFPIPREIGYHAGYLLEYICEELSWRLEVRIKRKKDDHYTLGDLLSTVLAELKKYEGMDIIEDIDKLNFIRNISDHATRHYASLERADAVSFAEANLRLYEKIFCNSCNLMVKKKQMESSFVLSCNCGQIKINSKKSKY